MVTYIYFVKCPNCEDEHFDFFDEAKEFALGCLSQKPIITQTEVCRNDFGECTDSTDLGTVWSWEDIIGEGGYTDAEPAKSIFTKDDLKCMADGQDPEFDDLDNSIEVAIKPDATDNVRKPIPEDMTIEQLVEAMEENEDTVECAGCEELHSKEDCVHKEDIGWLCPNCEDRIVKCTWCDELFDKSECRKEVDLGWLCSRCEMAIKSRGETLTFREGNYWDFLDEDTDEPLGEAVNEKETVKLEYNNLTITLVGNQRAADDWDEVEHTDSYVYEVDKDEVATTIWENFITEEDVAEVPGGLDALYEDDDLWQKFLDAHFDDLFEKYYKELLKYYREAAREEFQDNYSFSDYEADLYECSDKTSMLETLEDAAEYNKRLTACPECGEHSYDVETGFCIGCGFN